METPPFDSPAKPTQNPLEVAPAQSSPPTEAQAEAPTDAPAENSPLENAARIAPCNAPPPVQFKNVRVAASAVSPAPFPNVEVFAAPAKGAAFPNAPLQSATSPVAAPLDNAAERAASVTQAFDTAPNESKPAESTPIAQSPVTALPHAANLPRATALPPEVSPSLFTPRDRALGVEKDVEQLASQSGALRPVALGVLNSFLLGGVLACGLLGIGYLLGRGSNGGDRVLDVVSNTSSSTRENTIISAVKAVGPAVMNVDTTFGGATGSKEFLPNPGEMGKPQQGKGTGVVIDSKLGLMLTNAHVVAGAQKIQVTTRDGQKYTGRVLGFERQNDIAVVELSSKTLPAAKLAPLKNARDFQIGETAIAIGNPFAQANTVTVGVVSATGRTIPVPDNEHGGAFKLTDMIQTDAAINPGNSGGPLCNSKGEVIGINTAIYGIGTGLGFAIPINKAKAVANRIIKKGRAPQLKKVGFEMRAITDATKEELGLKDKSGALVQSVEAASPPGKAGLQAGDIVRRVDGKSVASADALGKTMSAKQNGTTARVEVLRNGAQKTLTWKVGK